MSRSQHPIGEQIGLNLDVEIKLSSDWKRLASIFAKSTAEFFLKGYPAAASTSLSGLVDFAASIKFNQSLGYRAWHLAVLSFAWSTAQVVSEDNFESGKIIESIKRATITSKREVERGGIFVPSTFLERPTTLPLYDRMLNDFLDSYFVFSDNNHKLETKYRLDSAFSRGIFEIWARKPEYFEPIRDAFRIFSLTSATFSLEWMNYRSRLAHDFLVKPVFGQEDSKISLAQLYVPLRGYWRTRGGTSDHLAPEESSEWDIDYSESRTIEGANFVLLDDSLDNWIDSEDNSDWLRLIGGGPGSGKSTTLKALASRSSNNERYRPLFIPLQYVNLEIDLRFSIDEYFTNLTDSPFTLAPLSRSAVEDGPPLLLIFDGLDELVAPGEAAKDVVGTFANKLSSLVSALSGGGREKFVWSLVGVCLHFRLLVDILRPKIAAR